MFKPNVKELKKIAERYSIYFLVVGVLGLLFSADANYDGRIVILEILDELLIISIGAVGLLTVGAYEEYASYYTALITFHTFFVGLSYAGTAFVTILFTIFFPECDEDTDPSCASEKEATVAIISILSVGLFIEFAILMVSVFALKNARELQAAIK